MAFNGLTGKVAIVTGASGGIGSATCRRLVDEGCRVAAVDLDRDRLHMLVADLGDAAVAIAADVASEEDCRAYVSQAVERFGGVDLFVNNAAILGERHSIADMPMANFDRVHAVNVRGAFMGLHFVLRQMIAQGRGGAIVNISSVGAMHSQRETSAYGSSKRAVLGLSNSAAAENGRFGIRVNAICPGAIDTTMLASALGKTPDETTYSHLPLSRPGSPAEIASFIAYLLSDDASYQTAGIYTIDGGMTH